MLGWLKRLFGWRDDGAVYHPRERLIYRYFDGLKMRDADPMVLYTRVMDKRAPLSAAMTASEVPESKFAPAAHKEMVGYLRQIFEVEPLDKGGLTEGEICALFDHFMIYTERLKKNAGAPPTSPETTSPSTPPSSGEGPPTPSTPGSGSTASGSSTGGPTPSPRGSESPWG